MFKINEIEYQSYFYIIRHKPSNRIYAGCRYSKYCKPSGLLKFRGYITSSNSIKYLIKRDGIKSFTIDYIRIFTDKSAFYFESYVLQNFKDYSFINISDNNKSYNPLSKIKCKGFEYYKSKEIEDKINEINRAFLAK